MTINVPTNSDELAEFLNDKAKMAEVVRDGKLGEVIKNYAATVAKRDSDIAQQVKEQAQAAVTEMLRANGQSVGKKPASLSAATGVTNKNGALYSNKAPGSKFDDEYDGLADYFRTVWHNADTYDQKVQARRQAIKNAASTTDPSGGGFLVPESLRSELQRLSLENAVVRPRARVIPMETSRVGFPCVDATSNVSSVYGGIVAYWTEEAGSFTESEPTFSQIWLNAEKLTALSYVNNELLTDNGASFEAFASQAFPEALAFYEDDAFLNGDGAGKPKGVYGADAAVAVTRTTSSHIKFSDVANMYARMLPSSLNRAVWVIAPDALPELLQMVLISGSTPVAPPLWLPGQNALGAPQYTLMGRPVVISEKAPTLGSAGDISFIDFGHYLVGDRMAMTVSSSPHFKFATDQTSFKVVQRVDGRPGVLSAITPKNGSTNTLTPFVKLAA